MLRSERADIGPCLASKLIAQTLQVLTQRMKDAMSVEMSGRVLNKTLLRTCTQILFVQNLGIVDFTESSIAVEKKF